MDSTVKTIMILVILLGVIATASYIAVNRTKTEEEGIGYVAALKCANPKCQKSYEGRIIAGSPPPYKCKFCLKLTAYRRVKCLDCGAIFANVVGEIPPGLKSEEFVPGECPECGGTYYELVKTKAEVEAE